MGAGRIAGLTVAAAAAGAVTWGLTRRWTDRPPRIRSTWLTPPVESRQPAGRQHLGEPDPFSEQPLAGHQPEPEDPTAGPGWLRTNFHGETVSLVAGPAMAAGVAAGIALAPGLRRPVRAAGFGSAVAIAAVGLYDDLAGDSSSKGLRGHLIALRDGNLTSGAVKVGVIGAAGLIGSVLVSDNAIDAVLGGAAVAGHANLLNLLDLRSGRAGKAALLHAPLVLRGPAAPVGAAALAATAATLPDDLGERTMLGDAGANTQGGLVGLAMGAREGRRARLAHLFVVTALTLASEKVSFTQVIENTPVLRDLDQLGRRT
jgi:UDP-GlcNAc:undecaprenyl-phosphate/decaprenyl-phosphate GlcNAc-1-phosphate transferase